MKKPKKKTKSKGVENRIGWGDSTRSAMWWKMGLREELDRMHRKPRSKLRPIPKPKGGGLGTNEGMRPIAGKKYKIEYKPKPKKKAPKHWTSKGNRWGRG